MVPTFGARLRSHRERQEIALGAIAAEMKIKVSLLEGLERDDLSYWPEGIFRRAYVRGYARAIGMDPEALVREFLAIYPDPVDVDPCDAPAAPRGGLFSSAVAAVLRRGARSASANAAEQAETERGPEAPEPAHPELSFSAVSDLCTKLGQVLDRRELPPLLDAAARIFDAMGLVVWSWDSRAAVLRASLANGYSDAIVARLPAVPADAPNAVASAFRSTQPCVVPGANGVTGALVVPLLAPSGCVGVLALEFQNGGEDRDWVRDIATILAAQLVTLLGAIPAAEAVA